MTHVTEFYEINEINKANSDDKKMKRCIFIATDDLELKRELKVNSQLLLGPQYELIMSELPQPSKNEMIPTFFSLLEHAIIDIMRLASADFLVCTFSSNMCRLAYELMQTKYHGDASWRFRSLDDSYYFHNLGGPLHMVVNILTTYLFVLFNFF